MYHHWGQVGWTGGSIKELKQFRATRNRYCSIITGVKWNGLVGLSRNLDNSELPETGIVVSSMGSSGMDWWVQELVADTILL